MAENISVRIYGKTYQLKTDDEVEPEKLAELVDKKMSELAEGKSTKTTQDLAVLTALNLAGELEREKKSGTIARESVRKRMEDLIFKLSQELQS